MKLRTEELSNLEVSKAEQIENTFLPMAEMLKDFESEYNEIQQESTEGVTVDLTKKAKDLRIRISKVRIQTEKTRKAQKEEYLRAGKAIDGVANVLKWAIADKENSLKKIEKYFEMQENERLEQLQKKREQLLSAYVDDAHMRDLKKFQDDEFEALLQMKKKEQEDKIKAEKKAEQERIAREKAEAEERERIRKENERLKAEAKKREEELKKQRAKEEAERKKREEKERKERQAFEAKIKAEREAKEKLEAEIKAEKERIAKAEREAKEQAERARQEELNRGDAEKVQSLIIDIKQIKDRYSFKSTANKKMFDGVCNLLDKVVNFITKN